MNRRRALAAVSVLLSALALGGAARADDGGPDWEQVAEIPTPAAMNGFFGSAAAVAGDTVFVAAPYEFNGASEGGVYAFSRDAASGAWAKSEHIVSPGNGIMSAYYANAIAADGDTLVILDSGGAHGCGSRAPSGRRRSTAPPQCRPKRRRGSSPCAVTCSR